MSQAEFLVLLACEVVGSDGERQPRKVAIAVHAETAEKALCRLARVIQEDTLDPPPDATCSKCFAQFNPYAPSCPMCGAINAKRLV